ncbi:WD40-repeat-containing domain protein [Russula brevipes]|nr:WD40-repeat-containing domain protein [Russula brevipes]
MLPTPSSSPQRDVLVDCTNVTSDPIHNFHNLPTPPAHGSSKRSRPANDGGARLKRLKFNIGKARLCEEGESDGASVDSSESEEEEEDSSVAPSAPVVRRKRTIFHAKTALSMSHPGVTCRPLPLPTRSLLRAYVSSHKTDVFACDSGRADSFLTPPYACAFTNAAKRGAVPHLAVATEQGTVYVWDTSRREELGPAPNRVDLDIHENGIFDLQWSPDDTSLATCSGDHTARITDVATGKTLHLLRGHTSTVKTVAWDPQHASLLSTGGRDGGIRSTASHAPVTAIDGAHGEDKPANRGGGRRKVGPTARTVTSLVWADGRSDRLISSGSFDGLLRLWDLRQTTPSTQAKSPKKRASAQPAAMSAFDPTIVEGARRARGLTSLVAGTGPTHGLLFGLGVDSPSHMNTNSFWVRLALSPDGRSLVTGSSATDRGASAFLFDASHIAAAAPPILPDSAGVQLTGQKGEVGGVDWAQDMWPLWRFDPEIRQQCDVDDDARWTWTWGD